MREDLVAAREDHIRRLQNAQVPLYPTWHGRTHTAGEIHAQVDRLLLLRARVTVAGRLMARRGHGGSTFVDLCDRSGKIQILLRKDLLGESYGLLDALDLGDILAATGTVQKTKAGEDTIEADNWTLLTKSLDPLPDTWAGLQDVETRARRRELDLLANEEARTTLRTRSTVIQLVRQFLAKEGFVEVETPILQHVPGGASARPFVTHHQALDLDLSLRIAPELYLKRLVIGGMERVFEIGRSFRNEGVDRQHNPEFTTCEFYMAYATVDDLIPFTEQMFTFVLEQAGGSTELSYQGRPLRCSPPWKQLHFVEALKDATGIDVTTEQDPKSYLTSMERNGITPPTVQTVPALVDELYKEVIRKRVWDPVILRGHPIWTSPLAKHAEDQPHLAQRIQLLVAGMELVNAYTELNDPLEQETRFREQERLRERGDEEAQRIDREFLTALRVGLPPTAGWGLGIDRLTMLLADRAHIRDVITFPLLRPEHRSSRLDHA